ncbi:MAG TPA: J domain-containing protein [Candidatus Brocadiia bacterium]|nr:DnaJ domain-containing protein [Candidatus Brocadiales bacterium]
MPEEQSYYEEMGIPQDATDSQIKEAYKKLAKKYHPDLNPDMSQWAATQMKKLNMMYNTLSVPLKRQEYDRGIGKEQASTTSSYPHGYSSQKSTGLFTAKTLRTAAIGTIVSGLTAFLILSFLPVLRQTGLPPNPSATRVTNDELVGAGLKPAPTEPLAHEKVDISKADVYYKQGVDYVKNGKLHEAIGEFEKAIEINSEHFRAHAYLGFVYDTEGRLDEAIHAYEKAIGINPKFADAYYGLAAIYNKKGMFDRAERELEIYKWLTGEDTE